MSTRHNHPSYAKSLVVRLWVLFSRALLAWSAAAVWMSSSVHAGGFEYPGLGTKALGRGGAFAARADDPIALFYNPARLAQLGGTQLAVNVDLMFPHICADRVGQYGDGISREDISRFGDSDDYAGLDLGEVCNDAGPTPNPQLALTTRLGRRLGVGFGVVPPHTFYRVRFGDDQGVVRASGAPTGRLPSPMRYGLVDERFIVLFPTVGAGYQVTDWLSIGVALQWGLAFLRYKDFVRATPGEDPSQDVYADLDIRDLFVPGALASVHLRPHRRLDVMLAFRYVDRIRAGGSLALTHGFFGTGEPGSTLASRTIAEDVGLDVGFPWTATFGIRYAQPRGAAVKSASAAQLGGLVQDAMATELWDLEFDLVYEVSSRVQEYSLSIPAGNVLNVREVDRNGNEVNASTPVPTRIDIPHDYSDQWSLRFGGDYNLIPGVFALRLGGSYETRGTNPKFANIDFVPSRRVGLHVGATLRLRRWDVSMAYAHMFQETLDVPPSEAGLRQVSADSMGRFVNAGVYKASFDGVALGVTRRF